MSSARAGSSAHARWRDWLGLGPEDEEYELLEDDGEGLQRSLSLGFLAMAPMLLAYELTLLGAEGATYRNTSELVLFRWLQPFGEQAMLIRHALLLGLLTLALGACLRRHLDLVPRMARIVGEGVLGAIVLGPVLVGLTHLLGLTGQILQLAGVPRSAPDLASASMVVGAGAWEELLFRVGIYSALYVALAQVLRFLGLGRAPSRFAADGLALVIQALGFAAFHLAVFTAWLGPGGESFELSIFVYRALAGFLLGVIFRWRGPGVAAWTHGLFNLALLLGAGPDVFL